MIKSISASKTWLAFQLQCLNNLNQNKFREILTAQYRQNMSGVQLFKSMFSENRKIKFLQERHKTRYAISNHLKITTMIGKFRA